MLLSLLLIWIPVYEVYDDQSATWAVYILRSITNPLKFQNC